MEKKFFLLDPDLLKILRYWADRGYRDSLVTDDRGNLSSDSVAKLDSFALVLSGGGAYDGPVEAVKVSDIVELSDVHSQLGEIHSEFGGFGHYAAADAFAMLAAGIRPHLLRDFGTTWPDWSPKKFGKDGLLVAPPEFKELAKAMNADPLEGARAEGTDDVMNGGPDYAAE